MKVSSSEDSLGNVLLQDRPDVAEIEGREDLHPDPQDDQKIGRLPVRAIAGGDARREARDLEFAEENDQTRESDEVNGPNDERIEQVAQIAFFRVEPRQRTLRTVLDMEEHRQFEEDRRSELEPEPQERRRPVSVQLRVLAGRNAACQPGDREHRHAPDHAANADFVGDGQNHLVEESLLVGVVLVESHHY
jgi:hypothetical protein